MFSQGQKYGPTGSPMIHTELGPLATTSTAKMLAVYCARSPEGPTRFGGLNHFHPSQPPLPLPPTPHNLNVCIGWEFRDIHCASFTFEKVNAQSPKRCVFFFFPSALVLVQGNHNADGRTLKIDAF